MKIYSKKEGWLIKKPEPLISVIIPTYCRPHWCKLAVESVLKQTYKNYHIFITDNSPNLETKEILQPYIDKYENIQYEHHPEYKNAMENWQRGIDYNHPQAKYLQWLMDDDILLPEKFEKMVNYMEKYSQVVLATSPRQFIDSEGEVIDNATINNKHLVETDSIINGKAVGRIILGNLNNVVGEPTTALVRKSALRNNNIGGASFQDKKYFISDFPTWLEVLQKGDLVYITEPLSQFRQHPGQDQRSISTNFSGLIVWGREICHAWENKFYLQEKEDFLSAYNNWFYMAERNIAWAKRENFAPAEMLQEVKRIAKCLREAKNRLS